MKFLIYSSDKPLTTVTSSSAFFETEDLEVAKGIYNNKVISMTYDHVYLVCDFETAKKPLLGEYKFNLENIAEPGYLLIADFHYELKPDEDCFNRKDKLIIQSNGFSHHFASNLGALECFMEICNNNRRCELILDKAFAVMGYDPVIIASSVELIRSRTMVLAQ